MSSVLSIVPAPFAGTITDPGWVTALSRQARKMGSTIERIDAASEQREKQLFQALRWLGDSIMLSEEVFAGLVLAVLHSLIDFKANTTTVSTGALRVACERLVSRHNELAKAGEPVGGLADSWIAHQGRVLRAVMAGLTVVDLVGGAAANIEGVLWTKGLRFPRVFDRSKPLRLVVPENEALVGRIVADQTHEVYLAVTDLTFRSSGISFVAFLPAIEKLLDELCAHYGVHRSTKEIRGPLLREEEACDRLGCTPAQIATMVADRRIVSVTSWTGEVCFPQWQFENRGVCPLVSYVLEHTPSTFSEWPLALFLSHHYREEEHVQHSKRGKSFFKTILKRRAIWLSTFRRSANGSLGNVTSLSRTDLLPTRSLYRVTKWYRGPFHFRNFDDLAPERGLPSGTGRLDLPKSSGYGTMYLTETPKGAWSEVFGHIPVLTLDDVCDRVIHEVKPKSAVANLADAAQGRPDLITNNSRQETCRFAHELHRAGVKGIRYGLAAMQGEIGYALFGIVDGVTDLRTGAGLGTWNKKGPSRPAVLDEGFWAYLELRDKSEPYFPIMLRRFPDSRFWNRRP